MLFCIAQLALLIPIYAYEGCILLSEALIIAITKGFEKCFM